MNARATPYMDGWKANLRAILQERGTRSELARWLCSGDGSKLARWKVQLAKVLNGPAIPDGEFVLAVDAWANGRETLKAMARIETKNRMDGRKDGIRNRRSGRKNLLIHK